MGFLSVVAGPLFTTILAALCMAAAQHQKGTDESLVVTVGAALPHTSLQARDYDRAMKNSLMQFSRSATPSYTFVRHFSSILWETKLMPSVPSPKDILECLCDQFLPANVPLIIYVSNTEMFRADTAAAQYFLQMANFLRIPVIAWNAANSGFGKKFQNSVILQLAPSIRHQAAAMLDILQRFQYRTFSVVTSHIAGHREFVMAIRERILFKLEEDSTEDQPFHLVSHVTVDTTSSNASEVTRRLSELVHTEVRILLLYATQAEADVIFGHAHHLRLTGQDYLWMVTQSVVGAVPNRYLYKTFPVGLVGVHFDIGHSSILATLDKAIKIFGNGLELFMTDPDRAGDSDLRSKLTCSEGGAGRTQWAKGKQFYEHLKSVRFNVTQMEGNGKDTGGTWSKTPVEFNDDGTLKHVTLEVVNLDQHREWQTVGTWTEGKLDISSIVWPGGRLTPPLGAPEKFHLRVAFLEEPPYLFLVLPDNATNACRERNVVCRVPPAKDGYDPTNVAGNETFFGCCSGFTIDLLDMLAVDIGFTYELQRVEDGLWGAQQNGKWNGLVVELLHKKADIVMTSLKINSERPKAVDFSVPFMETGIAVIVAKRTGIISPSAFLEPFDTVSWVFILVVSLQAVTLAIFLFEFFSPSGYGGRIEQPKDGHNFSLFRTYWLVWALLFKAAVSVDIPRGHTARYMANVWSAFAVVFLAIYTANLAAFMITQEEYYNLKGLKDERLMNPRSQPHPLRFGTIPSGSTESFLRITFSDMYLYMKNFSRTTVAAGVAAVKRGELDAFIYDASVLNFLVGQDDECRLLTVGQWYAMTGYGVAFPRNSEYLDRFNDRLLTYRDNGALDRLSDFWLSGACQRGKHAQSSLAYSYMPIAVEQYISAFILLGAGVFLSLVILGAERFYDAYVRKKLAGGNAHRNNLLTLISLNLGRSLMAFEDVVSEAQDQSRLENHKCKDPICDTLLWKVRRERDLYKMKSESLQKKLAENRTREKSPESIRDMSTRL